MHASHVDKLTTRKSSPQRRPAASHRPFKPLSQTGRPRPGAVTVLGVFLSHHFQPRPDRVGVPLNRHQGVRVRDFAVPDPHTSLSGKTTGLTACRPAALRIQPVDFDVYCPRKRPAVELPQLPPGFYSLSLLHGGRRDESIPDSNRIPSHQSQCQAHDGPFVAMCFVSASESRGRIDLLLAARRHAMATCHLAAMAADWMTLSHFLLSSRFTSTTHKEPANETETLSHHMLFLMPLSGKSSTGALPVSFTRFRHSLAA